MTQDLFDIYSNYLIAQSQHTTATGLSIFLRGLLVTIGLHDKKTVVLKNLRPEQSDHKRTICSYCKIEFLKIKTHLNHFAPKYKLILKANQMACLELRKLKESMI